MRLTKVLIPVLISVATISVCAPSPALADFSKTDWMYSRDILTPFSSNQASGYVRLELDNTIAGAGKNFKDVRVIGSEGREVPYQLVVEEASSRSAFYPAQIVNRSVDASGRLQFVIDLGKSGLLHNRIEIVSPSNNYKRQVSVYSSDVLAAPTASSWNLLTDDGYIFKFYDDKTRFSTAEGIVDYPQSATRYVLVVVENGPEGTLLFGQANVFTHEVSVAKESKTPFNAEIIQNSKEQTTELVVDLKAAGIPTREVTLISEGKEKAVNFSRTVRVFGSNDAASWSRVGEGYISRLVTPKFVGTNLSVSYPESSFRYYKIVVYNYDDAPLSLSPTLTFTQIIRAVVFEVRMPERYELYYGNEKAFAPRYDLARFFNFLETTNLPEAELGEVRTNSDYVAPAAPVVPFSEKHPMVLNIILALLVVIIGGFIFLYVWKGMKRGKSSIDPSAPPVQQPPQTPPGTV